MDEEPMSIVEQYIGRRWSLAVLVLSASLVAQYMGAGTLVTTLSTGFVAITSYYYGSIQGEKQANAGK